MPYTCLLQAETEWRRKKLKGNSALPTKQRGESDNKYKSYPHPRFAMLCEVCYNGVMKRKVYYVTYANSEDFQKGVYHFSPPFEKLQEARKFANNLPGWEDMNVRFELHNEIWERNEWQPDFDMGDKWQEVIEAQ